MGRGRCPLGRRAGRQGRKFMRCGTAPQPNSGAFRGAMLRRWLSVSGVVFLELNNPKPILLII